jgi:hypothetical protein
MSMACCWLLLVFEQVNNCLNSTAITRQNVPATQDSDAVKAMFSTLAKKVKRPAGWKRNDCKLVTYDILMLLTAKVLR